MHAGPKYDEFEYSSVCIEGRKAMEHRGTLEPDEDEETPTQEAHIAAHPGQTYAIFFKFHSRRYDKRDYLVITKVDGQLIRKTHILNNYHPCQEVDCVYTATAYGTPQSHFLRFDNREATGESNSPHEAGTIEIEVYRGAVSKTACEDMKGQLVEFVPCRRSSGTEEWFTSQLCTVLGPHIEDYPDGMRITRDFVPYRRDNGYPWFKHIYKYRTLHELQRDGLAITGPLAEILMSDETAIHPHLRAPSEDGTSVTSRPYTDYRSRVSDTPFTRAGTPSVEGMAASQIQSNGSEMEFGGLKMA